MHTWRNSKTNNECNNEEECLFCTCLREYWSTIECATHTSCSSCWSSLDCHDTSHSTWNWRCWNTCKSKCLNRIRNRRRSCKVTEATISLGKCFTLRSFYWFCESLVACSITERYIKFYFNFAWVNLWYNCIENCDRWIICCFLHANTYRSNCERSGKWKYNISIILYCYVRESKIHCWSIRTHTWSNHDLKLFR